VCSFLFYLTGSFPSITTDLVVTSSSVGDQSQVLKSQDIISGVVVKVKRSNMNEIQCIVIVRIAWQACVFLHVLGILD